MRVIELFAGAGGAALGLEAAGCESLARVEIEPDPYETMRAAGLECIEGDVRDLSYYEGLQADLVWSSFPCQAWSTAGKRRGAGDERGGDMWQATVDAIDCLEPEWFAAENVTGLLQHKGCSSRCLGPEECPRSYFDNVILSQLRARFAWVGFRVLNASAFGVPQHRRRVIIVAGPHAIEWPQPTHGEPSKQDDLFGRSLLPWESAGDALGLMGIMHTGGEDYRERDDRKTRERPAPTTEPAPTVGGGGNAMITPGPRLSHPAPTVGDGGDSLAGSRPEQLDRPSPTVTATEAKGSRGEHISTRHSGLERASDALYLATGRRILTIEECATLQDFPTGHPFQGNKTSRYRQVGNAVPPKLAEVVGRAILKAAQ